MTPSRLRDALWRPIDPTVKVVHLETIENALVTRPSPAPAPRRLGRRSFVLATALSVALLGGAAFAAERAVPGDLLYPVKKLTEEVRGFFDDDIAARHRIQELDELLRRDRPSSDIDELLGEATREVDKLPSDSAFIERLADLRRTIDRRQVDRPTTTEPGRDGDGVPTTTTTTQPSRDQAPTTTARPTTPTTVLRDEPPATTVPRDEPVATTTPRDEPPATTRPPRDG